MASPGHWTLSSWVGPNDSSARVKDEDSPSNERVSASLGNSVLDWPGGWGSAAHGRVATAIANPILSFLDVKRILFQKITDKKDELKKAFQLLDTDRNLTVSKSELRRTITAFLMPLTREQFQDVLAQGHLYFRFAKHYNIDKDTSVDYNVFLKNLSINNNLNLRYVMGNQEISWENQRAKDSKKEHLLNSVSSEGVWKNYSLDDIERIFCQELSKSYEKIEKALSAGDPSKGGYVSLNYLKIVLDTFVYRLPRRIFIQLMKSIDCRNQSHKEDFLTKLLKHAGDRYISLKKALLLINTKSDGEVTREELWHILSRMAVKLSDSEFKELLGALDPGSTGVVKVSTLIDLLEDTPKASKVSPCVDPKTPLLLAWDSVEETVHDAILRNLQAFYRMLQSYDLGDTGLIGRKSFKKIMLTFCPSLTNEHIINPLGLASVLMTPRTYCWDSVDLQGQCFPYHHKRPAVALGLLLQRMEADTFEVAWPGVSRVLCSRFHDTTSGRIFYKKLLACIGVNGPPPVSPILVPKDQLLSEHFHTEKQPPPELSERARPPEVKTEPAKSMTKEEVVEKLKACIQQQDPVFRGHFLGVSKDPGRKITVHDFKKVLEDSGMPMDDHQLALLAAKIGYKEEGMSYLDFATGFEDHTRGEGAFATWAQSDIRGFETGHEPDGNGLVLADPAPSGPEATLPLTPAPSKSHLNSHFITAEECLALFPGRVKESFQDTYAAFFKIDADRDGIIGMQDLHRLLTLLLLNLKDEEFERFLGLLGLRLSVTLNFREFHRLCEKRPLGTDDAPQRLIRPKQKVADSELACEQAHEYLVTKAKNRWADLSKNFIETDNEGNGILRRRDIKNALYGFDIPLTPREFEKLWTRYDTEGRGHITYQEFLEKLGISYSPAVHRPCAEDYFNFMGHFTKPQQIQEEIRELQQGAEKAAVPARDKLIDHYEEISKELGKLDKSKGGYVSVCRVRDEKKSCPLEEEELTGLLHRMSGDPELRRQSAPLSSAACFASARLAHPSWAAMLGSCCGKDHFRLCSVSPSAAPQASQPCPSTICPGMGPGSSALLPLLPSALQGASCAPHGSKLSHCFCDRRTLVEPHGVQVPERCHLQEAQESREEADIQRGEDPQWATEPGSKTHPDRGPGVSYRTPPLATPLPRAFSALDKEDTGFVKATEFGQVLKDFCCRLTDNQYHYFLRKLRIHLTPYIHWKYFLQNFGGFLEETADEWAEKMPKGPPPRLSKEIADKDILARLHRAVASHYQAIAQEFENFDTMKTNTVSRDEFRAICTRYVQILTDEQSLLLLLGDRCSKHVGFGHHQQLYSGHLSKVLLPTSEPRKGSTELWAKWEPNWKRVAILLGSRKAVQSSEEAHEDAFDRLWSEVPVNAKGKLKYQDLLSRFSTEGTASPPATGDSARAQRGSSVPEASEVARSATSSPTQDPAARPKLQSHPCNCEPIESKLRKKIQGCWRELLKECKQLDVNRQGEITTSEFLALVEKFNLDISKEERQQLATKYDLRNKGTFAYCDFIQGCVLLLKAGETSLLQRLKIQNAHRMKEAGVETMSFYSALLRIQPQIVHCWRPMRRTFKAYDAGGTGLLSVADFRKVLRQYSINLSEEEFFHILEYYDKTLSSKISYNDFLRAFLQ
ncbi:EF-hand calcium-binding domain-containing protein 6 [Tupaia chinensis]|uniref:EF-hand calcium-binding domain-containing protein 6 n=1 Tax=Tupaia chinensis TaxID=246437 RepID=L9KNK8_TUPCH|nr:EF-hand calcium-binding domain-containing protein 6 [Tupaia chinensis]